MASPSGSDHSTHSSIYWGSASDSEAPAPGEFPDYRPTSSPFNSIAAPPRPRLSSPRVFQDFFSTTAAGTSAVQTSTRVPSAPSQPSVHDFPRAFENVNRAVQTAHEAFRNTPIIDLTTPPPRERTIQDTGMARKRMQRASPTSLSPDSTLSAPTYSTAISPGSSRRSRLLLPQNSRTSQSRSSAVPAPESTSADGRAPKRLRILYANDGSNRPNEPSQYTPDTPQEVEAVDLTEVDDASDLSRALSKQRQDTIQAQMKRDRGRESSGRTPLSSYKCPICMDTPEDATVTSCGHLFCHKCIIDTLKWSEEQRRDDYHAKVRGTCPVCRKPLARNDKPGSGRTLVPLELKNFTTEKKAIDVKGKGVVRTGIGNLQYRLMTKDERESSTDMWNDLTEL